MSLWFTLILFGLLFMLIGLASALFLYIGILVFVTPYFFVYAKAVDEAAMVRSVNVKKLREGDWLYKDVKIGRITEHQTSIRR